MDNDDWDLSSIVRSCKATTFSYPSTVCEIAPKNLTTTITPTTNSITSPINTTPSSFGDFIFNQETSSAANTYTTYNDWDLSSIVRSCKPTTFTNHSTVFETPSQDLTTTITTTTTNSCVSPVNTTTDFTFNQQNSSVSFAPLKPNDFLDLNKLRANFNSITHIPTTTNNPFNVATPTCSLTTTTFSTHITPNIITNINSIGSVSNQNPTFFNFSAPIKPHQMQPNVFSEKDNFIPKFNPTTSFMTPKTTMTTSTITTPTTTNHTTIIPTPTFTSPTTTIIAQTITPTHPQQQNLQTGTGKNKNLETSMYHVKEDKLSEDPWQWRKYGQKPIRGSSLHSRSYYKCSSFKDCPARKIIDKSKTEEKTTYRGKHDHHKPEVKQNSGIGTSQNKSSPVGLNEKQSHVVEEAGSSQDVHKLDSHNKMMLQCDEPEISKAQVFHGELEVPYSETEFIGSYNDDDSILIPNMSAMSEDFLLEYNHLDGGSSLP